MPCRYFLILPLYPLCRGSYLQCKYIKLSLNTIYNIVCAAWMLFTKNDYICIMEYLSRQRYDEIASELNHLITVVYPEVRDLVAETSAQGDRSENAGYREARRRQAKTISRIRFLQKILQHSRVIDPDALPKDRVCLLSHVEFTNLSTNVRMKFEIVSPHEMNLEAGKISLKSPIGAALMGKKVGETVEAQTPSGVLRLRIDDIIF